MLLSPTRAHGAPPKQQMMALTAPGKAAALRLGTPGRPVKARARERAASGIAQGVADDG